MPSTVYLTNLAWQTGDISYDINQALQDYQAVELPSGKLPGYLGNTLHFKKNGQKLLGRATHIEVQHDGCMIISGDALVSSYMEIEGLRLERTVPTSPGGHGVWIRRNVEKPHIRDVHIIGAQHGFHLGPTDDGWLHNCTAERCSGNGFTIMSQGPVDNALQWSSWDCRALLNGGNGLAIQALPLAGHVGGVACGTHRGFTTYANGQHGVVCLGTVAFPLHEPRFEGGFLGDDRWNEMMFDCGADVRVVGTRIELPRERHGIYLSPNVRHAWLKGLTITGGRVPGSYGIYSDAGQDFFHLSDSEIYNFGASGVYSNATYGWICGLQSAENANYGLFLEHPNFRVYALSCYANGMGDFGGPLPGVFV